MNIINEYFFTSLEQIQEYIRIKYPEDKWLQETLLNTIVKGYYILNEETDHKKFHSPYNHKI